MKKFFNLFVLATVIVAFAACKGGSADPKGVATQFVTALDSKDYTTAKSLSTEESAQMLSMVETIGAAVPDDGKKAKIDKMTCTETGEKASCTYCCDRDGKDGKVDLVKKDGKWLVDFKKAGPAAGEGMGTEEAPAGEETAAPTPGAEAAPAAGAEAAPAPEATKPH